MNRSDLHAYQNRAIDFICEQKKCGLFLDMGLGKTVATLTAVSDLIDACIIKKVLVIAPLRVCNSVWKQETKKWTHLWHLRINIATGTAGARTKALNTPGDVYVINRENVTWLMDMCKGRWPFDAVIIDESSSFKSHASKRFRALKKVAPITQIMVLLTGTPSPNGLLDLWSQIFLIDQGKALGRGITAYRQRFFTPDYWGYSWEPKPGSHEAIQDLIKPRVLSMQAEDYIEVPDRIDLVERVEMPEKVKKDYDKFERNLYIQFEDAEVEAVSAGVLANKLLQFANGTIYVDDDLLLNWKGLHDAKLTALDEIIEENPGENILIAYNYRHDLARLRRQFPEAVVLDKNPKTIDRWNAGEIRLLLAHPGSCGHGLNLQSGGSMLIFFSLNWNLEYDKQICARLHRQGQTQPVRVVRIISAGTIDERVLSVLDQKDAVQNDLLRALRG